ncbi:MAG: nitroreductase family deazaflavin-dependent oxidoreductase [Vulcanimicrobiota bacterium]
MQEFISQVKGDFTPEQAAMLRQYNQRLAEEFRSGNGKVEGDFANAPLGLLTSLGAKSGKSHVTPLVYSRDGENYVIAASKAGLDTNPAWYFNLLAHPDTQFEVGGQVIQVRAELAEGAERQRLFEQHASGMPFFRDYQQKTAREIPVFVLKPR